MGEMMMTPEQLAELRKAAIAATPGPWIKNAGTKAPAVRAATEASEIAKWIRICVAAHTREGDTPQNLRAEANTDFIARANPYVVLQLLDKISAQQARIAELEQDAACYHAVPAMPTPEMVAAAEAAYMPFGDMHMALMLGNAAAQKGGAA